MRHLDKICLALMILALLAVGISQVHDFDVFWQLQSGRYLIETHQFIRTDLFTLAPDVPRFEHCWLHDLALYAAYSLGGYAALSVWKGLMIALTATVLAAVAISRGASLPVTLFVLPVVLLTAGGWLERPQLWTYLLFALFLLLLERFRRRPSAEVFLLAPLALLWANLHAGSLLAVAVLAAYLVGIGGEALWRRQVKGAGLGRLALAVVLVGIALLLTPYPAEWLRTLSAAPQLGASVDAAGQVTGSMSARFNMDWTPTTFAQTPLFYYALGVAAAIMLLGWRAMSLADLCLMGGLALMGLKLVRHTPFFFFAMVAILPVYLDTAVRPLRERLKLPVRRVAALLVVAAAFGWGWLFYQPLYRVYGGFNTGLRGWHYPLAATAFIRDQQLPGNLYNTYDWGGYLEWTLFPKYRVFWDQRQNSAEMFQLGWEVMAGQPSWLETFRRFAINTVVTRPLTIDTGQRYPLLDLLRQSPEWSLVFADDSALVFVRDRSLAQGWLAAHRLPKERMDETILATARLMTGVDARRYLAWYEMAQVYLRRRQLPEAKAALAQYLQRTHQRDPQAEQTWRMLESMTRGM